jgi:hypothetical protein
MIKSSLALLLLLCAVLFVFTSRSFAQNGPVLYFCEKYDNGEMGVDNRFTSGEVTVIVKSDYALGLKDVNIHMEKFNCSTMSFEILKNVPFTVTPDKKYIVFNSKDLSFDSPGIYKVYLIDGSNKIIANSLVQITK